MGMLSDDLYTVIQDKIGSVHARTTPNMNLLSLSGGETAYELRVDGEVADTHRHGTFPKAGSMFATLDGEEQSTSIRVDVSPGRLAGRMRYRLFVDKTETPLIKSSEANLKSLWHKKRTG